MKLSSSAFLVLLIAGTTLVGCGDKGGGGGSASQPAPVNPTSIQNPNNTNSPYQINNLSTDIIQGKIVNRRFALAAGIVSESETSNSCAQINNSQRDDVLTNSYDVTVNLRGRAQILFEFDNQGVLTVTMEDLGGTKKSAPILPSVSTNFNQATVGPNATYSLDGATQSITVGQFATVGPLSPKMRQSILARNGVYERNRQARSIERSRSVVSEFNSFPSLTSGNGFDPNFTIGQNPNGLAIQNSPAINQTVSVDNLGNNYTQNTFERFTAVIYNTLRNRQHILGMVAQNLKIKVENLASDVQSPEKCKMEYDLNIQKLVLQ